MNEEIIFQNDQRQTERKQTYRCASKSMIQLVGHASQWPRRLVTRKTLETGPPNKISDSVGL